ncbi:MAG: ThuA domain-containing protein [Verrucomicrobiae bacterium]|nr:ThuA domain-containing protein [Verrucomicrobiae bacterium]
MKCAPFLLLTVLAGLAFPAQAETDTAAAQPIRVALYVDAGTGDSREKVVEALGTDAAISVTRLKAAEIQTGKLKDFDVLIHPGGSGSKQGKCLAEKGRTEIRNFVSRGGGYVGFCAGAYLATNDYDWSLHLIDAKVVDRKHWARGNGPVQVQLSPAGRDLLGVEEDEVTIHYAQGPLLARREWADPKMPAYESLGLFASEMAEKGAPSGIMVGTTAIARVDFGKGRVFCFSPHPEMTEGLAAFVPRAIRWAAKNSAPTAKASLKKP